MFGTLRRKQNEWIRDKLGVWLPTSTSGTDEAAAVLDQDLRVTPTQASPSERPAPQSAENDHPRPLQTPPVRSAVLEHAVRARLMTFEELADTIGRRPSPDRFFGLKKMSQRYKAVEQALGEVHTTIKKPLSDFLTNENTLTNFKNQLANLISVSRTYQAKYDPNKDKNEYNAIQKIIDEANVYKDNIEKNIDIILKDPDYTNILNFVTLEQAIRIKRRGIRFQDCKFSEYNDQTKLLSQDRYGAGNFNTVDLVAYKNGEERIFKPELETENGSMTSEAIGIDSENPHFGNRNIASRIISDIIGANVIPDSVFAFHGDSLGLLMEKAPGIPVEKSYNLFKKVLSPSPPNDAKLDHAKLVASLHAELNALEWCDALTGQADRHNKNYFISIDQENCKITGIDNDMAFGKNTKQIQYVDKSKIANSGVKYDPSLNDWIVMEAYPYYWIGQPNLIDKKIFDKIVNVNFDSDVRPQLQGLLTEEEIEATAARFSQAQNLANNLKERGCVVENWQTWRWQKEDGTYINASQYLLQAQTKSLFACDFSLVCQSFLRNEELSDV